MARSMTCPRCEAISPVNGTSAAAVPCSHCAWGGAAARQYARAPGPADEIAPGEGAPAPPQKSNTGMIIGLIVGAVGLLGLCCVGVCGGLGYYGYNKAQEAAEAKKKFERGKAFPPAAGQGEPRAKGPAVVLEKKDKLLPSDPVATGAPGPTRSYPVQLQQGKKYEITMNREGTSHLNPYLRLLDSKGKELAKNTSLGGDLHAEILFTAPETGQYTVQASNNPKGPLSGLGPLDATGGGYKLTVQER